MKRLNFLTRLALAITAAMLTPVALHAAAKPNVVFILADDLGYGELGCFGQKLIKTPNIDKLAAEGMRFTQAYCGSTVCAPSRCALMTGKHTGHTAIRGNKEIEPEGQQPMPADTFTVAHLMKKAGYATGIFGKWGLGKPDSASVPNKMGFDYFYGYNCQRKAHEYYPEYLWRNDEKVMLNGKSYSHDLIAEEALGFLKKHRAEPFFLYVPFTIPHSKLQVPDLGIYKNEDWPENEKTLAAMITRMDKDVGRIMALIKELGLDDNTLVFFASDNGGVWKIKRFQDSGPLRGSKRDMYEGGIRSPSIARWPGHIKAGVVSDQVWAFWDLMPTMAELTGQKAPAGMDGISILPALLDGKTIEHPPLYVEFYERGYTRAARIGDWKAVCLGTQKPIELYDLKTDLAETIDVAAQHPDVVKKMEEFLKSAHVDSEVWTIKAAEGKKGGGKKAAKKEEAE